ncbi:helix-turn-helix domain-containing protein [Streptomyces sp. NPDC058045]|uniref:helix-turn-helix domain-containing protein n=1 Tax=Streptomyces sp. NPDC058045 TaxID=3346311 RepID=UPI0036F042B7
MAKLDGDELEADALAASIGRAIRQARQDAGLTLRDVAKRAGMSQPFLSQLENGRSMPSLMTLHKVAAALGATAHGLLAQGERPLISIVRGGEGRSYALAEGVRVRFLADGTRDMEPNEVIAEPDTEAGAHTEHAGEEFVHVLAGSLEVRVGTSRVERLESGDSMYYPATIPHRWHAGPEGAHFLIISSPPSF